MNRTNRIGLSTLVILVIASYAAAQGVPKPATSGVSTTVHNLNNVGITVPGSEVCRPCHTPHNSKENMEALWNHQINENATYQLYNSKFNTRYASTYVGLDEGSRMCLSCHDGAIAVDNFGGKTNGTNFVTGEEAVGLNGDLTNDHPIGLPYPGIKADGTWTTTSSFKDPTTTDFTERGVAGPGVSLVTLSNGLKGLGCTTCHSPHGGADGKFLRISNNYSYQCLKCHTR